jgi:hypothetical protein
LRKICEASGTNRKHAIDRFFPWPLKKGKWQIIIIMAPPET